MNFVKRNSRKIASIVLSFAVLSVTLFNSVKLFSSKDTTVYAQPNSVQVQKIDDNHAKLHCDAVKTSNGDFLFSKTKTDDCYQYDITDLSGTQKLYGFSSSTDIKFDEGISKNPQLCGIIWGAIAESTAWGLTAAAGSTIAAGAAIAPTIGTIVTMGTAGVEAGVAFSAGAGLAVGLIVAATPVVVMVGAAGGAIALG